MLSLHRTVSVRYLRQRWLRAALILASIAVGVAALVATQTLKQSTKLAARNAVHPLMADLMVVNGDSGVPRGLDPGLTAAHIAGVQQVEAIVLTRVVLPDLDRRAVWLLGLDYPAAGLADNGQGIEVHLKPRSPLSLLGLRKPVLVGSELAAELS